MKHNFIALGARSFAMFLSIVLLVALIFGSLPGIFVYAQETPPAELSCNLVVGESLPTVSFANTVQTNVIAGDMLSVSILVSNPTTLKLSDVSLGLGLFADGGTLPVAWSDMVKLEEVGAQGEVEQALSWQLPANIETGTYELRLYSTQSRADYISNQYFTVEGATDRVTLTVAATEAQQTYFQRESATVANTQFNLANGGSYDADGGVFNFSVNLFNPQTEQAPENGQIELNSYIGLWPLPDMRILNSENDLLIIPGFEIPQLFKMQPENQDRVLVLGTYRADSGNSSQFVTTLKDSQLTDAVTQSPIPRVALAGVQTRSGQAEAAFCLSNAEHTLNQAQLDTYDYQADYELVAFSVDAAGVPDRSSMVASWQGSALLGTALPLSGATVALDTLASQPDQTVLMSLTISQSGLVTDQVEWLYRCDEASGCKQTASITATTERTIFGFGVEAFVKAMQLVTLALLLIVISIFVVNSIPLLDRAYSKMRRQNDTNEYDQN